MKKKHSRLLEVLLSFILVLSTVGIIPLKVQGAVLTSLSDTIEDSRPSPTTSNHTIQFTTASLVDDAASHTITITFPAGFNIASITEDDIDLEDDGVDKTTAANCAGTENFSAAVTGQVLTFTACSGDAGDIAAGSVVAVKVGDNATDSGTGANKITNHVTPAVYDVTIGGTFGDTGTAQIVIISTNTASVTIDEVLSFTVTAQTPADCADYDNTAGTEITTTSTTVPFSVTAAETFKDGCQELAIGTNAAVGYTVSVKENDQLNSGTATIADGTCDGACTESSETNWATPTNNGFAYCMQDYTGDGSTTADAGWGTNGCDAADTFFKLFSELNVDSPEEQTIMSSAGPVSDTADIGYRLSVDSSQAAGTYSNNIIFVATPKY